MILGFSGTRHGLTEKQRDLLTRLLDRIKPVEARHGDCIGADTEFHHLCRSRGVGVVLHPPPAGPGRACNSDALIVMPEKGYLSRNRDIVDGADMLIACPADMKEIRRSGTWSTIRYARKTGKRLVVIYPDGRVEEG